MTIAAMMPPMAPELSPECDVEDALLVPGEPGAVLFPPLPLPAPLGPPSDTSEGLKESSVVIEGFGAWLKPEDTAAAPCTTPLGVLPLDEVGAAALLIGTTSVETTPAAAPLPRRRDPSDIDPSEAPEGEGGISGPKEEPEPG